MIIRAAYGITRRSADGLLDRSLPVEELQVVELVMRRHMHRFVDYHRLRTRKTGADRELDLHVTVPSAMSVEDSHTLVETIEVEIRQALPRSTIVVHVEPCDGNCDTCRMTPEARVLSCGHTKR